MQQWAFWFAGAVALVPMLLIGGCLVIAASGPKIAQPPAFEADLSPAKQAERKHLIDQLIQNGAFFKVERPAKLPHVWITPAFRALDFDTKQQFISVVFLYYQPADLVVLKDSQTGQRVGTYSPTLGLSID